MLCILEEKYYKINSYSEVDIKLQEIEYEAKKRFTFNNRDKRKFNSPQAIHPKQPFKHFDLPTIHFAAGEGYVPPRTRDSIEADRRHNNPPDTLILEHQSIGVAKLLALHDIAPDNPADRDYINENMAMALLNAAYHSSAAVRDAARRRVVWAVGRWSTTPSHRHPTERGAHGSVPAREGRRAARRAVHDEGAADLDRRRLLDRGSRG